MSVFQTAQKKSGVSDTKNEKYDSHMVLKKNFNLLSNKQFSVYSSINPLLHLQQTLGDQDVQRLVRSGIIQTKLTVSQPNDIYEQEADRVADQVMRMPSSSESYLPIKTLDEKKINRKCKSCEDEEEEKMIHRKTDNAYAYQMSKDVSHSIDNMDGGGLPLDVSTRKFMESRFGFDFSNIRIHADERAARLSSSLNSFAYTIGNDILFGKGQYNPYTNIGKKLLAHELTHVVQQNNQNTTISRSPDKRPQANITNIPTIQAGDVVVRAGTFSGKNPLVNIIGEEYNHGGIAIDSKLIHHVESKGYETTSVDVFLAPENANGGAVIRFHGPFDTEIKIKAVDIAKSQRYVKIPGNPFSTSEDLKTVNCNEFIHGLFRQAIAEIMVEAQSNDHNKFQQMLTEYGDPMHAQAIKNLISSRTVEFTTGGLTTGPAVAAAEAAASTSVSEEAKKRGEVHIRFEGRIERRNLYPAEWATSLNPLKAYLYYNRGFYTVAVIQTYTPDSFVNSKYFSLMNRIEKKK
jgi:hypothetical protein